MIGNLKGTNYISVFLHILGWCCFLFYPFIIGVTLREEVFLRILFHTSLLAGFFYLNSFLLIPRFLDKGKITVYISYILISVILITVGTYFFSSIFNSGVVKTLEQASSRWNQSPYYDIRRIVRPFISSLFVFAASTSYKFLSDWYRKERQRREAEKENLLSELSFLRSQISPHFLFNTLNNIYSLSLSNPDRASDSIIKLSHLLRYMLYESNGKQVMLEKEIDYLQNYIDLQKMRLNRM